MSHGGELFDSGSHACNRTDPNVSEGSVQPATGNEQPEEEDEQATGKVHEGSCAMDCQDCGCRERGELTNNKH